MRRALKLLGLVVLCLVGAAVLLVLALSPFVVLAANHERIVGALEQKAEQEKYQAVFGVEWPNDEAERKQTEPAVASVLRWLEAEKQHRKRLAETFEDVTNLQVSYQAVQKRQQEATSLAKKAGFDPEKTVKPIDIYTLTESNEAHAEWLKTRPGHRSGIEILREVRKQEQERERQGQRSKD